MEASSVEMEVQKNRKWYCGGQRGGPYNRFSEALLRWLVCWWLTLGEVGKMEMPEAIGCFCLFS